MYPDIRTLISIRRQTPSTASTPRRSRATRADRRKRVRTRVSAQLTRCFQQHVGTSGSGCSERTAEACGEEGDSSSGAVSPSAAPSMHRCQAVVTPPSVRPFLSKRAVRDVVSIYAALILERCRECARGERKVTSQSVRQVSRCSGAGTRRAVQEQTAGADS